MDHNASLIAEAAALREGLDLSQRAVCPGCHTPHPSLTRDQLANGIGWKCARCGERWDAGRLATVAAYEAWVAARKTSATSGAAL